MHKRDLTVRRRAAYAKARAASAAGTRQIRDELAGLPGVDAAGLFPFLLAAAGAAGDAPRPTLRLAIPSGQGLAPALLPWPEEAPDQHKVAIGDGR